MSYEDYRKTQIEDGLLFQDFVVDAAWQAGLAIAQYSSKTYQLSVGESRTGVEIKHDKKFKETGNLYIEVAEKANPRPGPFAKAGIMRDGHWLYAIGDYDVIYIFANNLLRNLSGRKTATGEPYYKQVCIPTSQGFLLPKADAEKYAALILRPEASEKMVNQADALELRASMLRADLPENERLVPGRIFASGTC